MCSGISSVGRCQEEGNCYGLNGGVSVKALRHLLTENTEVHLKQSEFPYVSLKQILNQHNVRLNYTISYPNSS